MASGIALFGFFIFAMVLYAAGAVRDGIAMWRDLDTLDRMMYRVGTVTFLKPQGYEIGVDFGEADHFPRQKAMGARESLVRSLEVGREYIFVCVDRGRVCIAAQSGPEKTSVEQDLQLARKYYNNELK